MKRSEDEQARCCWQEETHNISDSSVTWNKPEA